VGICPHALNLCGRRYGVSPDTGERNEEHLLPAACSIINPPVCCCGIPCVLDAWEKELISSLE
jgi:hypothetical protein